MLVELRKQCGSYLNMWFMEPCPIYGFMLVEMIGVYKEIREGKTSQ